jgi:hypothetical protein
MDFTYFEVTPRTYILIFALILLDIPLKVEKVTTLR